MIPHSDNPIQDAIDHLRSLESDCGDKADSLDNFINEVTEVKDQLDEHATSISELIIQLDDVAAAAIFRVAPPTTSSKAYL